MWLKPIAFFLFAILAKTGAIENVVVFGDSHSDHGNFQRWTNGPIWSEMLAAGYDAKLFNFAYTGSVCDSSMYADIVSSPNELHASLKDQVEMYYKLKLDLNPKDTVYAIWIGMNDVHYSFKSQSSKKLNLPDMKPIATCIMNQVNLLHKVLDAEHFIVFNSLPLQVLPYFRGTSLEESRGKTADEFNERIKKVIIDINRRSRSLEVDLVDIHSLLSDMTSHPASFHLSNTKDAYVDETCSGQSPCPSAEEYIWWDQTHLTTAAQRLIANSVLEAGSFALSTSVSTTVDVSSHRSSIYVAPANKNALGKALQKAIDRVPPDNDPNHMLDKPAYEGKVPSPESMTDRLVPMVFSVLVLGALIIIIRKYRHVLNSFMRRSRGPGRFTPLRNSEPILP